MKKKQDPKNKKKPVNFQQRFEGKKNAIGKGGLFELLDLHQPFSLNSQTQKSEKDKNEIDEASQVKGLKNRRLSLTQKKKQLNDKQKIRSNRTQIPKRSSVQLNDVPKLPKISKSSSQKIIAKSSLDKLVQPEQQYWQGKKHQSKKRSGSELNFRNLMRADYYAVEHFDVLQKFQKRLRLSKRNKLQI